MAGSTPQSQTQPSSAEEEALKRNTDCVYFLASPLTCKKGSECDYRHSDTARVNPRDCWFWMNGNCLNAKCAFRHPPLDGLLGTQLPTPTGPSAPVSQPVAAPAPHVPNTSTKQGVGVPCIFFQKGYCIKGDWCPFLHAPNSSNTKPLPVPGTSSAVEPPNIKKPFGALEKSVQQKVVPINAAAKSVKGTSGVKPPVASESGPTRNEFAINRRAPQLSGMPEFSGYRSAPPVSNGNPISWSNHVQEPHLLEEPESMNSKDADEVSREPSPGFDVLVDDEGRDSDFYTGEDRYVMSREHEADYDIDHPTDYNAITGVDDERYHDRLRFDSLDHRKGQYAWEQHRTSSDRMSGGSYRERRPYSRLDGPGQVEESDLRHRLAKHKKPNGLRSVISHDHSRDVQVGDRGYQGLRRDEQHISSRENSLSSRLRGRIRLPGRSPSPNNRDVIGSVDRGRLSPVRTSISSYPGRIRDRIKDRVEEAYNNGGRSYSGVHSRRDIVGENSSDFAPPKSLAELKKGKNAEPSKHHVTDQQPLGKRKHLMPDTHQQSENVLSFEGPKPLTEILKRKKRETIGSTISNNKDIVEDKIQEEEKGATNNETSTSIGSTKEVDMSTSVQNIQNIETEESKPTTDKLEAEDGILGEDGVDQESEHYEQRDGESDYEQIGGEDYELYEGENGDAEGEEYVDEEDDDDDFAKKMGVMYS